MPTVLPAFDAPLTPQQLRFASAHNGFLMQDATGAWLGGAQGFTVTWSGALLIERDGTYEFWAGAPRGRRGPARRRRRRRAGGRQWRVVLRRGQRTWVILSHHWAGEEEHRATALPLKRGAYELTAELVQPAPEFGDEDEVRPQHTGFQREVLRAGQRRAADRDPAPRAVRGAQGRHLAPAIEGLSPGAAAYLNGRYASSLRDIRRTYQRAFKALLFCHRLGLSARREPHGTSELGYLLAQPQLFAGSGYYRGGGGFTRHAAYFDFDFLPLRDDYHPPRRARTRAPTRRRSASRPCSTGGSGCSTTPPPAPTCAAGAGGRCGTCSRRRRRSSPPIPATCCGTWPRTPGTGRSTCATSRARAHRCTR